MLGIMLHPDLLKGNGADYVYLSMTYSAGIAEPFPNAALIPRYTYNATTHKLTSPVEILKGLPSSRDHQGARPLIGPDRKLYNSIGDQDSNHLAYLCIPNEAQILPGGEEISALDWGHYKEKIPRFNLNDSIPDENPVINGVRSHVCAWGFRNPRGTVFSPAESYSPGSTGPTRRHARSHRRGGNYG